MPAEVRLDWDKMYPYILPGFKHIDESRTSSKKRKIDEISRCDCDDELTQRLELELSS